MKCYTSSEGFKLKFGYIYIINRPNADLPPSDGELPISGEMVQIDGNAYKVKYANYLGDSDNKYYPRIRITIK